MPNENRADEFLGKHPESGKQVMVRLGKFGPMVQIGSAEEYEEF